ncbi:hypothetical protein HDU67_007165 [Dinochytrium kinnereticum]|nr:hypothetical protein HDU67_007165 [Dinochytrium kinnereticum]
MPGMFNQLYKSKAWIVLGICLAVLLGLLVAIANIDHALTNATSPASAGGDETLASSPPTGAADSVLRDELRLGGNEKVSEGRGGKRLKKMVDVGVRVGRREESGGGTRNVTAAVTSVDEMTSTFTTAASPSAVVIKEKDKCRNKRGVKIGQIIVGQPNVSSIVMVGSVAMVSWQYTPLVKNFPKQVDIKINSVDGQQFWTNAIVSSLNVSNGARGWLWRVGQFADGSYRLRVVPDGKETAGKKQDELPCFFDGDPLPGNSAIFKITRTFEFDGSKDRFPPSVSPASCMQLAVKWLLVLKHLWWWLL